MSYDAVRDKWADGSLEAADDRRQRSKSSSDAASVSAVPFLGCNEELEGSALVNTGFEVLSSPLSEACLFVDTGSRVMRGRDWSVFHGNVDGGAGKVGKVLKRGRGTGSHISGKGWVLVHWPSTGYRRWHRMGAEDCFDLLPC
ncbi:uncharacterized protein LOC143277817 [Babylonia areolata]|uniref:uncharacterized protein LOC143277817 n=1 Tax=Babylonia areolata TaxID=304850 RepID=UPI003FD38441